MGDTISPAFADPAKYDLYDCKQLETERKSLASRIAEVQGLMAKAETGVAGSVVAEVAYRNDYIALRGQSKLAEEAWRKNRCQESKPEANAAPTPPTIKPAPLAKGGRSKRGRRGEIGILEARLSALATPYAVRYDATATAHDSETPTPASRRSSPAAPASALGPSP